MTNLAYYKFNKSTISKHKTVSEKCQKCQHFKIWLHSHVGLKLTHFHIDRANPPSYCYYFTFKVWQTAYLQLLSKATNLTVSCCHVENYCHHVSINQITVTLHSCELEASVSLTESFVNLHNRTVKNGNCLVYLVQMSYHVLHFYDMLHIAGTDADL